MSVHYDYIIIGAGCAGLSLAVRMAEKSALAAKRVLIIDKAPKTSNDRTWCFWEKGEGYFDDLVHQRWQRLWLRHPKGDIDLQLNQYQYKLIRGIDFYRHGFATVANAPNMQVRFGEVHEVNADEGAVLIDDEWIYANQIFSSILLEQPTLREGEYYLLQHFRGWWIEMDEDCFDPQSADLMNFNTSQQYGAAFMYVLPVSKRRALVEYTLFTEDTLTNEQYNAALEAFIGGHLGLKRYRITEVENGIIPMTNMQFPQSQAKVCFIGTAGGQTKASTGYTFQYIQKQSAAIVENMLKATSLCNTKNAGRFKYYDSVLLRVLHERKMPGDMVFYHLFRRNKAAHVLAFLDNETSFLREFIIMNTTPKGIFLPAAIAEFNWRKS